jgi:hypothetical protein
MRLDQIDGSGTPPSWQIRRQIAAVGARNPLTNLRSFGKFVNRLTEGRFKGGSVILREHPVKENCSAPTIWARAAARLGLVRWTRTLVD